MGEGRGEGGGAVHKTHLNTNGGRHGLGDLVRIFDKVRAIQKYSRESQAMLFQFSKYTKAFLKFFTKELPSINIWKRR